MEYLNGDGTAEDDDQTGTDEDIDRGPLDDAQDEETGEE